MPQTSEVFRECHFLQGFIEVKRPGPAEVEPGCPCGHRETRVVDVVVVDQCALRRHVNPDPPIGDQLSETVAPEERIKTFLPNASRVPPARHVAEYPKEVAPAPPIAGTVPAVPHPFQP